MARSVEPLVPKRGCPICGKPRDARYDPFCSKRCAEIDLSRWLKGVYAIPGAPADDEDEAPPAPDDETRKS
ncbi:DNA gyrase inhibitor YacG [Labrys wisconsinensis]|uniref:DNA gyrase inhibitor YacG n=1 Tax=Labrys wisconsinensis TaxID=425677 RepID=A0ABU0JEB6_9HYPH|nr:DNA gyrase inhibitor YacG [Labrys wisconsinensis]MDQ0472614.1 endogenous inhibitor of DNA gyrase (YacG/DUF329 family) [Labrys wisconsinensis]